MVRAVGLEPTRPCRIGGFKDRCVYQFHHTRKIPKRGAEYAPSLRFMVGL